MDPELQAILRMLEERGADTPLLRAVLPHARRSPPPLMPEGPSIRIVNGRVVRDYDAPPPMPGEDIGSLWEREGPVRQAIAEARGPVDRGSAASPRSSAPWKEPMPTNPDTSLPAVTRPMEPTPDPFAKWERDDPVLAAIAEARGPVQGAPAPGTGARQTAVTSVRSGIDAIRGMAEQGGALARYAAARPGGPFASIKDLIAKGAALARYAMARPEAPAEAGPQGAPWTNQHAQTSGTGQGYPPGFTPKEKPEPRATTAPPAEEKARGATAEAAPPPQPPVSEPPPAQGRITPEALQGLEEKLRRQRARRDVAEGFGNIHVPTQGEILLNRPPPAPFIAEGPREDIARIQELMAARDAQQIDPVNNPQLSGALREQLAKVGIDIPEGIPASAVMRTLPGLSMPMAYSAAQAEAQGDLRGVLEKERQSFLSDSERKDLTEAVRAASNIEDMIQANPMGQKAVMVAMAKAAGDTGRLSDQDIQRWAKRMGLAGSYDSIASWIQSEMTEGHKAQMLELAGMLKEKNMEELQRLAASRKASLQSIYPNLGDEQLDPIYGLPEREIRFRIQGQPGVARGSREQIEALLRENPGLQIEELD